MYLFLKINGQNWALKGKGTQAPGNRSMHVVLEKNVSIDRTILSRQKIRFCIKFRHILFLLDSLFNLFKFYYVLLHHFIFKSYFFQFLQSDGTIHTKEKSHGQFNVISLENAIFWSVRRDKDLCMSIYIL